MSITDKRSIVNNIKKSLSYQEVMYNITGIKDILELQDNNAILVLKNKEVLKIATIAYFSYEPILFNINPYLNIRKNTIAFKIGSIIYQWLISIGCDLKNTYESVLYEIEEYLLSDIEETEEDDIDLLLARQSRLNMFIAEKQLAYKLHDNFVVCYNKLGINERQWRICLRRYMSLKPQYVPLIASFLSLLNVPFDIHKDFLSFSDDKDDEQQITPCSYIYSDALEEYINNMLDNYTQYYRVYGKRRKIYERLYAFTNELSKLE